MKKQTIILSVILLGFSCTGSESIKDGGSVDAVSIAAEAQNYLDSYTEKFLELRYASAEAEWSSNTMIIEGDTMNAYRTNRANEELAIFTGSIENIEKSRGFLRKRD